MLCFTRLRKSKFKGLNKYATFIKGDVLKTLNHEKNIPDKIALLRLDTDWYESTKLELEKLYQACKNGILLIDDYEDWQGCKKAVDEYFKEKIQKIILLCGVIEQQERSYKEIS